MIHCISTVNSSYIMPFSRIPRQLIVLYKSICMISKWKQPWLYGCKFIFFPHFDEYYIAGKPIKLPCLLGDKLYTHQLTNLQVSSCKLSSWGLAYYKLFLPYGCLTKFFVIPGAHWQSAWGFTKSAKKKIKGKRYLNEVCMNL